MMVKDLMNDLEKGGDRIKEHIKKKVISETEQGKQQQEQTLRDFREMGTMPFATVTQARFAGLGQSGLQAQAPPPSMFQNLFGR